MQSSDELRNNSASKLLAFPNALLAVRATDEALGKVSREPQRGFSEIGLNLGQQPGSMPHDLAVLRRPAAVEAAVAAPTEGIGEVEGLAVEARKLITSLEQFSSLLAGPGVMDQKHQHLAEDLKLLTGPLSKLIGRLAVASTEGRAERGPSSELSAGAGASRASGNDPVFAREPLRPVLASGRATRTSGTAGGPQHDPGDAGWVVKNCERLLAAVAGPRVALHVSGERGLGALSLGSESLTRVLINLVKNASEAMPGGGRITIAVRRGPGSRPFALISVQDSGTGIPAHALGQIFQAGFTSKKSQCKWPATTYQGLGLTIVRELVEDAGGSVRVVSTLGKGTTFELKLPCRRG
jgi:signal transduction histidine kinase